jgi:predicted AAA+ superfamily ATPase
LFVKYASIWINREISPKIRSASEHFPVVVLTGARQVGKSSLLKHLFPKYHYVTLDLPSIAYQAKFEPELFLKNHPAPVIIDEVQYAPELFRFLKIKID